MELQAFYELSNNALIPGPKREECETQIINFMNTQPLEFISLSLQLIVNTPPDARRAKEIGATFLFQSVKDRHLLEINAVPKFWEIFSQIVPNVILNESMPDTVKTLVVCTLSALAVYTYKYNESTIVQQYIVELGKRKEFETFVLLAVREILLDGQCFYGFSAEFLMSLILKTLLYNSSIVPRAQLFFIVAGLTGDTNFFLQIFPQLLSKFPQDQLHSLLSAIDTFSEKHANMFQDIITDFTQFLCSIALNRECSFRNLAIFILGSLAQGDPHMCMNTPFYQQVFQCLITVISEIDDTSPFEFDVNDVSPPACAAVIFHSICLKTGCDQYFIFLNQYQDLIFRQDPNNYTWQQAYAVLYAFTLLDSASIQAIVPNITSLDPANKAAIQAVLSNSLIIQFTQKLVSFLQPSVTNPRIRAVIYRNISHLCRSIANGMYQRYAGDLVLPILLNFTSESHPEVQKYSAKALSDFFSINSSDLFHKYSEYYPCIKELLSKTTPELQIYLFECIAGFAHVLDLSSTELFYDIKDIVCKYYPISEHPFLKVSIIYTFITSSISYYLITKTFPTECIPFAQEFFRYIISIKETYFDMKFERKCHQCIISLFFLLGGNNSKEFIELLLPNALKIAESELPITILGGFDDPSDYLISSYYRLLSKEDQSTKVFTANSNIIEIQHQMEIICEIAKCLKKEFRPYLGKALEISKKWIESKYISVKLIRCSWDIFGIMLKIFNDEYDIFNELLIFGFKSFTNLITYIDDVQFIRILCNYCMNLLKYAYNFHWINNEIFIEVFNMFMPTLDKTLKNKLLNIEQYEKYSKEITEDDIDIDKRISFCDQTAQKICDLIRSMVLLYPNTIFQIFLTTVYPLIQNFIENPASRIIGFHLMTTYVLAVGVNPENVLISENVIKLLADTAIQKVSPFSEEALIQLIDICKEKVPLRDEFLTDFYRFYIQLLSDQRISDAPELTSIADIGLAAYTVFIQNYMYVNNLPILNEALEKWFNFMPIWEENPTIEYIFSFMATLLENQNEVLIKNEDNFMVAINQIASNIGSDMITLRTKQRLKVILKVYYDDPNYQIIFKMVQEQFITDRFQKLIYMLNSPM